MLPTLPPDAPNNPTQGPPPIPPSQAYDHLDIIEDYDPGTGEQPCVHTFLGGIGAHWDLPSLLAEMCSYGGVYLAGENSASMSHGFVIVRPRGSLFVATKE